MDAELARRLFAYEPETGSLRWIDHPTQPRFVGRPAGGINGRGYMQVCFQSKQYYIHRLAWLITYGEWPSGIIDHINCDPLDNRICNLRLASRALNAINTKKIKNRRGDCGIRERKSGMFEARIKVNQKEKHLGTFRTKDAARAAYRAAYERVYGDSLVIA